MEFFFGKKKKIEKKTETPISTSIENLQKTLSLLDKKDTFLSKQIEEQRELAKQFIKKNRNQALLCLRKVKMFESEQNKLFNMKMNVESQLNTLSNLVFSKEIIDVTKETKNVLEKYNKEKDCDPDFVDGLMDDVQEGIDRVNEVSEVLSRPIGPVYDESELLKEFEEEEKKDVVKEEKVLLESMTKKPMIKVEKEVIEEREENNEKDEERDIKALKVLLS